MISAITYTIMAWAIIGATAMAIVPFFDKPLDEEEE